MDKLLLLTISLAGSGLLFVLALPLAFRRVGPNRWYGFRTPRTLGDERLWYEANAEAGKRLAAAGVMIAVGATAFYFIPRWRVEHYALSVMGVSVLSLLYAMLRTRERVSGGESKGGSESESKSELPPGG
jgi:uncharacterized membrane protein